MQTGSFNKPDAGTEQKINANMFDILAGYKTADLMGLNLSLNFHQDSGTATGTTDNQTYQPLFYDRHNHEGLMDIMNWGNLTYFAFKASMMPSEDLETGLGAFVFSKTQSSGTFNAGAGPFTVANSGSATDLGTELDLYANKSYVDNIKINSRVGYFIPGGALKNATVPASDKGYLDFMLQASVGL